MRGHVSRDLTAIEAREKPAPKPAKAKHKRGRPRKGEEKVKEKRHVERQLQMGLPKMIADLPRTCDVENRRNAKGYKASWISYKPHIDAAGSEIPFGCLLTSASPHDNQATILLATMTSGRMSSQGRQCVGTVLLSTISAGIRG